MIYRKRAVIGEGSFSSCLPWLPNFQSRPLTTLVPIFNSLANSVPQIIWASFSTTFILFLCLVDLETVEKSRSTPPIWNNVDSKASDTKFQRAWTSSPFILNYTLLLSHSLLTIEPTSSLDSQPIFCKDKCLKESCKKCVRF